MNRTAKEIEKARRRRKVTERINDIFDREFEISLRVKVIAAQFNRGETTMLCIPLDTDPERLPGGDFACSPEKIWLYLERFEEGSEQVESIPYAFLLDRLRKNKIRGYER